MKRLLVIALGVAGMLLGYDATAQFAFGIKGGVNTSKLGMGNFLTTRYDENGNSYLKYDGQEVRDNLTESFESRTGWVGGVFFRFGRVLFIQPEVLVSTKGGTFNITKNDGTNPQKEEINVKYSNIDVPILVGLKLGPIRINGGPMASFRIGENQKLGEAFKYYTSQKLDDALAKSVFGYQFGGGLDIFRLNIDVRREGTFSDVAAYKVNSGGTSTTVKQKLSSWQVTLGIKF